MGFSGGFHGPSLCTNGSAGYLMQLSVNFLFLTVLAFFAQKNDTFGQCDFLDFSGQNFQKYEVNQKK